ncbi:MAG: hypothetical protein HQK76_11080 [Desulfobacterales bacterium]|nr:hypothetical protein [Desulfobacterales bacterium]
MLTNECTEIYPYFTFQRISEKKLEEIQKILEMEELEEKKEDPRLLCKQCKNIITSQENAIFINGNHLHIFTNPSGVIFEIGCFSIAEGCINHGQPTFDFTWFPGFAWRFCLCSNCRNHMGWFYQSSTEGSFYGLISANLIKGGNP